MPTNKERESLTIAATKAQAAVPVVLITGALTGIGRATALAFARQGAHIVVSGRNEDTGKTLVADLHELQAESTFIKSDVRHEEEVRRLVDETVKRFGREALLQELASRKGDGEILQWVLTNAQTPRSPWEIQTWFAYFDSRGPDSDVETLTGFAEYVGQHSRTREDIKTWFDALDLDDFVSFGGKP